MLEWLADAHGVLLRRDAVDNGIDDNALRRAVQSGRIVRLRQGAYVLGPVWQSSDRVGRHRLLVLAVRRQYGDDVALSHTSACIEQGGPTWGLDLSAAHVTNLYGIGERRAAKVVHHRGVCRVDDVTRLDGGWITSPPRTAMDTACIASRDAGVAVLDDFQHRGLATRDQLEQILASMRSTPDTLNLLLKLRLSDGKAESVGETRSRLLFRDEGLPAPVPQFEVRHPAGHVAGRVDFAWPERRVMLEFDGYQKYLRLRRKDESIEQTILREKAREDHLRELTGWLMVRLIWADLDFPTETANRIWRAFAQAVA
ncbi:type IV toxin-antitoxin system AbiEi family antitoxin domain-containing protein [Nocardioides antri]|uniref:Type IV toxin-antitoxin system AbiEi family antitoxin domain-containing protein n=1 Tax=Nocardioides antri TaxID=2607659 RepID=A0A5B1MC49_9ACTN|nr:type IV toxin-antitoxin system AbiEi family antitoxin domain-containing protein [Nocardioides antri]KAA1429200.1 type IV toxin-antitoxin system AbiEi family antitoxin domain-containing protein [Nocardioides antri]